jgi:dTDP-4-dehydrorhamnose 3,5-epimerase
MTFETCEIEGLVIIQPRIFNDERGLFYESYNQQRINEGIGLNLNFVQDNVSVSKKNVLRGLHFQMPPHAQGKLVSVLKGSVLDVAVDLREKSPNYGKHYKIVLNDIEKKMFWIPEGFAHGFIALEENTIFNYKCTNFYNPNSEKSIIWNDPQLSINWGSVDLIKISEKDQHAELFSNFASPF